MMDYPITESMVMTAALSLIDETVAYEKPLDDEFKNDHYFSLGVVRGIMDMVERLTDIQTETFGTVELLNGDYDG